MDHVPATSISTDITKITIIGWVIDWNDDNLHDSIMESFCVTIGVFNITNRLKHEVLFHASDNNEEANPQRARVSKFVCGDKIFSTIF